MSPPVGPQNLSVLNGGRDPKSWNLKTEHITDSSMLRACGFWAVLACQGHIALLPAEVGGGKCFLCHPLPGCPITSGRVSFAANYLQHLPILHLTDSSSPGRGTPEGNNVYLDINHAGLFSLRPSAQFHAIYHANGLLPHLAPALSSEN